MYKTHEKDVVIEEAMDRSSTAIKGVLEDIGALVDPRCLVHTCVSDVRSSHTEWHMEKLLAPLQDIYFAPHMPGAIDNDARQLLHQYSIPHILLPSYHPSLTTARGHPQVSQAS